MIPDEDSGDSGSGGENGGIWERHSVYRSNDDRLLILGAFSGSSNAWEFYDTSSCRQLAWLEDVHGNIQVRQGRLIFPKGLPAGLKHALTAH